MCPARGRWPSTQQRAISFISVYDAASVRVEGTTSCTSGTSNTDFLLGGCSFSVSMEAGRFKVLDFGQLKLPPSGAVEFKVVSEMIRLYAPQMI